jgi:hypothetical protein
MNNGTAHTLDWWMTTSEPEPVKRVLALAALRQDADDPVHDYALTAYPPQTRRLIVSIGDDLETAERLDSGDEATLRAVLGVDDPHVGPIYDRDGAYTEQRDEYRARALHSAQLVASVRALGRAS